MNYSNIKMTVLKDFNKSEDDPENIEKSWMLGAEGTGLRIFKTKQAMTKYVKDFTSKVENSHYYKDRNCYRITFEEGSLIPYTLLTKLGRINWQFTEPNFVVKVNAKSLIVWSKYSDPLTVHDIDRAIQDAKDLEKGYSRDGWRYNSKLDWLLHNRCCKCLGEEYLED